MVDKMNGQSYRLGKVRTNPLRKDTDRGGVRDGREVASKSDPSDIRSGPRNPSIRG